MKTRRSRRALERAIEEARTVEECAVAHYDLAVFHDNNSREAEAIPHYERALGLGLDHMTKTHALAWLASSLYKTGKLGEAGARADEALLLAQDQQLMAFLLGLRRRIMSRMSPSGDRVG